MMVVAAVVMGLAPSYPVLVVGAAVFGLGNGAMDVSMNALGVTVEQARRRPVMSRLHACFSIGNLVGALVVVVLGAAARGGHRHALSRCGPAASLLAVLLVGVLRVVPQSPAARGRGRHARGRSRRWRGCSPRWRSASGSPRAPPIDWSSLHVAEVGDVSPSAGAWGLACVAGFMVVIRLLGDLVVERLGRAVVVAAGRSAPWSATCSPRSAAASRHPGGLVPGRPGRRPDRAADLRPGRTRRRRPGPRPRGELRVRRLPGRARPDRLRRLALQPAAGDARARGHGGRPDRDVDPAAGGSHRQAPPA